MTDKDIFRIKDRSFFLYLLFSMILLTVILVGIVVAYDYYTTKNMFDKNSQHLKRQTEQDIVTIIKLTDESFDLYDSSLNEQMRRGMISLMEEYERTARTPSRMNLTQIKSNLGEEYDIYVINESGVIEFTTFEPELGMDFKTIPYFFEYLTKIRNSEGFFPDRIVGELKGTGKMRKFAYMPTPDHRYIIELGFAKTTFPGEFSSVRYKTAIENIASSNPYIERVRIFNSMGKIADNTSEPVDEPTRIILGQLLQQRNSTSITLPGTGKSIQYLFIDLKTEQYGSDASRIIEITYNNTQLEKAFFEHVKVVLIVLVLALAIGICGAFLLSRYLVRPISAIVKDVNRISSGDLDWKISLTNVAEFQVLEQSINTMVESLRGLIKNVRDGEILQREMIDQLPVAVFLKDTKDGKYTFWNKASEQIFGLTAGEVIGKTDKELFSEEMVSSIQEEDQEAERRHVLIINKKITTKSRGQRVIHMLFVAIFDSAGNFQHILGIGEDLTEQTLTMKTDLLFSITRRDILDQMSVIMNHLERAQLKSSPDEMLKFFDKTLESVETIRTQMAFVRSLQDIGLISPKWQSVRQAFRDAVRLMPAQSVDILVEIDDIYVYADPLFSRVFYNLLTNSIQYRDHELTKISLHAQQTGDSLTLVYEDNGRGIPEENKEKIFEYGFGKGMGFSLFLTRELLGYTGMTIIETGEPGKGARFEISVPRGKFRKKIQEEKNP